jgi:hypothetical protein
MAVWPGSRRMLIQLNCRIAGGVDSPPVSRQCQESAEEPDVAAIGREQKLAYEPGEHRTKHCWPKPYAGVVRDGARSIGKCPSVISRDAARELLDDAEYEGKVPGHSNFEARPKRMWNVHKGIVYEAVPTQAGAYHGYPWFGRPGRNRLPRKIRAVLQERAEQQGFKKEFRDWMTTHER